MTHDNIDAFGIKIAEPDRTDLREKTAHFVSGVIGDVYSVLYSKSFVKEKDKLFLKKSMVSNQSSKLLDTNS